MALNRHSYKSQGGNENCKYFEFIANFLHLMTHWYESYSESTIRIVKIQSRSSSEDLREINFDN